LVLRGANQKEKDDLIRKLADETSAKNDREGRLQQLQQTYNHCRDELKETTATLHRYEAQIEQLKTQVVTNDAEFQVEPAPMHLKEDSALWSIKVTPKKSDYLGKRAAKLLFIDASNNSIELAVNPAFWWDTNSNTAEFVGGEAHYVAVAGKVSKSAKFYTHLGDGGTTVDLNANKFDVRLELQTGHGKTEAYTFVLMVLVNGGSDLRLKA
jgi:hypothetical protein